MKQVAIETETRPIGEWLPPESSDEIVYLTRGGRTRFALVPLDEGDEETLAIQKNAHLMARIAEFERRAMEKPSKSLAALKAELGMQETARY